MKIWFLLFWAIIAPHFAFAETSAPLLPATLVQNLEATLAKAKKSDQLEPWVENKVHHALARGYAYLGNSTKRDENLAAIKEVRYRHQLALPYFDSIYSAAREGDSKKIFGLIDDAHDIAAVINQPRYNSQLIEFEYDNGDGAKIERSILVREFCEVASFAFLSNGNAEALEKLEKNPNCSSVSWRARYFRIGVLTRDGRLNDAYNLISKSVADNSRDIETLKICLPEDADTSGIVKALLGQKASLPTTLMFLAALNGQEQALDLLRLHPEAFADTSLRKVLLSIYEELYKSAKYDEAREIARRMKLFGDTSPTTEEGKFIPSKQWWVHEIDVSRVLPYGETGQAFSFAMDIQDSRARFHALQNILLTMEDDVSGAFPGCNEGPGVCALREMEKIAQSEADAYNKNLMYGLLSEFARMDNTVRHRQGFFDGLVVELASLLGLDRQSYFLRKITNMNMQVCYFDMCENGTVIKLRKTSKPSRAAKVDNTVMRNWYDFHYNAFWGYHMRERDIGTAHPVEIATRDFLDAMNRADSAFRLVTIQNTDAIQSDFLNVRECPVDMQREIEKLRY